MCSSSHDASPARAPQRRGAARRLVLGICALALGTACANGDDAVTEQWPQSLALEAVSPIAVLPDTTLTVRGEGFVGEILGTSRIRFRGTYVSEGGGDLPVDTALLAAVEDPTQATVTLTDGGYDALCPLGDGVFTGTATLEVASLATANVYPSAPIGVGFQCHTSLTPELLSVDGGSHPLNARLTVLAEPLLLGPPEGESLLEVSGCFLPQGAPAPCADHGVPFTNRRIPLEVTSRDARRDARFPLTPELVGLHPGTIDATVRVVNVHADGLETQSAEIQQLLTVLPSRLDAVDAEGSSLGGFVDFTGAGFVGGAPDEITEILVQGSFQPDGAGSPRTVDTILVTTFDSGERARYVLDEQDSLGQLVDLRSESGTLSGTFTPRFAKGADTVTGDPITGSFRIAPVRQVVYVSFTQGYRDALTLFGLQAAEALVRERVLEKAAWIYRSINVSFQDSAPTDYLLYAQVDITGIDPNGLGLMGYDNSPGKDVGNERLYDRLGGANALTQEDGYPGYGGVFVESFLSFSAHPPPGIELHPGSSPLFDEIFDPLRPSRGGDPVAPAELEGLVPLATGEGCPAPPDDRAQVIRCAVFVAGNLLGGTMAHEVAHSLGLADPGGDRFHNSGEEAYRLMDAGGNRPFDERAELSPGGPEMFCRQNYEYLISILPTGEPDPVGYRISCF